MYLDIYVMFLNPSLTFYFKMFIATKCQYLLTYCVHNYTTTPVSTMKDVVRLRSSTSPYSFCWRIVSWGHVAARSWSCRLHLWRTCSAVWSSSPHGHFGDCTSRYFLYMCAFSLLCPQRSLTIITFSGRYKKNDMHQGLVLALLVL